MLVPRSWMASPDEDPSYGAFLRRMRELGWGEGRNVAYEWRYAEGKYERLPALAQELVNARVEVLVASTPPSVAAAMRASTSVPIVFGGVGDPVALGFVASFARPGGNLTGVSNQIDDIAGKYLEFLRAAIPGLARVASLLNPDNNNHRIILTQLQASARRIGVEVTPVEARNADQIADAIAAARRAGAAALIIQGDGFLFGERTRIAEHAIRHRIATIGWTRDLVAAGGLMSYGQNVADDYRKVAEYVDRILRGARPADLPVQQPTSPKLVLNRRTAKALGLTLSPELMLRVDEVIE